ncbi:hypothetical protein GGI07_004057 [Coemansia sp. Benny D115]|nr:hypothetical protein GGI07_004057 [Coemansia sp. Benny D115]
MLLNLSPTTQHVHFNDFHMFGFDDAVFADIVQSDSLRTLNLSEMEFTMDQIVKLASKFKNLDKLTVALKDYPNRGLKAPDNNEVQRWKGELKAYTSNVRTICIESTSFPNSRRGVEYVVLMANILEGVGRVAFKPYGSGDNLNI